MTSETTVKKWSFHSKRSIGAVAAGFVITALLSIVTDVVLHATGIFPPWGDAVAGHLFILATAYRVAYTVLGGYVTAAASPHDPMSHVMALGVIGTVAATVGAVVTWNAGPAFGPHWYPLALVVTALPSVWLGGKLRFGLNRTRR